MNPSYRAGVILTDYDIRTAISVLGRAGFRTYVMERGTICAYKGHASYGFAPRHGRFSKEAIERAIADNSGASPHGPVKSEAQTVVQG